MRYLLILALFLPFGAFGCSNNFFKLENGYWKEPAYFEHILKAKYVFLGKLKSINDEQFEFEVTREVKGNLQKNKVLVQGSIGSSCELIYHLDKEYLFYLNSNIIDFRNSILTKTLEDYGFNNLVDKLVESYNQGLQ